MPKNEDDDESFNDYFKRVRRAGVIEGVGLMGLVVIFIAILMEIAK